MGRDDVLNIAMLAVIALLLLRFLRTGGIGMLRMMEMPSEHAVHAALMAERRGAFFADDQICERTPALCRLPTSR